MTSFLDICNDVARESGTFPDDPALSATASQTGREKQLTEWVKEAYETIQRSQPSWRWLHADFSGSLLSGTRNYAASALGISERFSHWVLWDEGDNSLTTIYKDSEGQNYESHITYVDYGTFRRVYGTGTHASATGKPTVFSVNYSDEMVFYPTPDAGYTVRGVYYKSPQLLSGDATEPEMPEGYHRLIKYGALVLLGTFDEVTVQSPAWRMAYATILSELQYNQLPRMWHPGALA